MSTQQPPDMWTSAAYKSAASFVPALTTTVLKYLHPQPGEHILDLGCGDGQLTAQLAATVSPHGRVLGLDASASFISSAEKEHSRSNCSFRVQDCTKLDELFPEVLQEEAWDKVFSNAALHWILREERTRVGVFRNAHRALKTNGVLVFEMGGAGNVAEVQAACRAALLHAGLSAREVEEANPWFFPSTAWMEKVLTEVGLQVEVCEIEYRPTKLNPDTAEGTGGLVGWLRLMAAPYLNAVPEEGGKREKVLRELCEVLEPVVRREEDGSKWLGYTRLRAVARKT